MDVREEERRLGWCEKGMRKRRRESGERKNNGGRRGKKEGEKWKGKRKQRIED